jgi:hypothetical protein
MRGKVLLDTGTQWGRYRCQQRPCTDDIHDARQIVGEHAERHLARDLRQCLHQEVRSTHPHLERAEGMLKRQILEEAVQAGANLSEVARRCGIAARVLFRWKQELTPSAAPVFVAVQITDANAPSDAALGNEERAP